MSIDAAARIVAFLDSCHVMSLATQDDDGPHAANLFYACDRFALVWLSDPATRHSRQLERQPRVAVTIAPDYSDFPQIRGLQLVGRADRLVDPAERARARHCLETRYRFLNNAAQAPHELRQAYLRAELYRLVPARITFIDNTRGLGFKEMLEFDAGGNPAPVHHPNTS
jgi:uncharacterized protein YhbP (UPF0306 family)